MQTLTTPCKHEHHQIGAYAKAGKVDPTHTTTLRNAFVREMKWRYLTFARAIKSAIDERDCFGLKATHILSMADVTLPGELAFAFPRTSQKVAAFMDWIQAQNKLFLESKGVWTEGIELITAPQLGIGVEDVWTNKYIHSAYQKGIFRARQEMKKAGYNVPSIGESGGLGVALNQPMHIDRLGLVYSRTYEELKGINASMSSQISRVLAQGMAEGRNPRELAVLLASTVMGPVGGLGITDTLGRFIPAARRAEIMARTEVIRAHHVATIQEYRNWGLEGVQVQAEWATAGDDRVCDECASLEGKIFTLEEIESMIPRHPQCRCIALPIEQKDVDAKKAEQEKETMGQGVSSLPIEKVTATLSKEEQVLAEQAIADWKQGREYMRYFQAADLGKQKEFEFQGNDILKARKISQAKKEYNVLNTLINKAENYEGKVFKFVPKDKVQIQEKTLTFLTKESWTKDIQGMSSFASEDGVLLEYVSKRTSTNKFVDIEKLGFGNFEIEREVLQQANAVFKVVKSETIKYESYFHDKTLTLTKIILEEL